MQSLPRVDVKAVRKQALQQTEAEFIAAKTTEQRHYARLALIRARRAIASEDRR